MTTSSPDAGVDLPDLGTLAPRLARAVVAAVLLGYLVTELAHVFAAAARGSELVSAVLATVAIVALQLLHCWRRFRESRWRAAAWITVPALAAACYLPLLDFGLAWGGVGTSVIASVLLLVRRSVIAWTVVLAVAGATAGVVAANDYPWHYVLYVAFGNLLTGAVIYAVTRFADLIADVHAARRELAGLAVERERTRFARDLHDLLGYSLSAIVLKSELAQRLLGRDVGRARDEIDTVLGISRQALSDVRSVARSYRELSLAAQADAARAMLESAGVEVDFDVERLELDGRSDTALATTLREAITNLLRHSTAAHCSVRLHADADAVRLTIGNDGVVETDRDGRYGDGRGGLDNLRTRLAAVGGTLDVQLSERGEFTVVATVPTATAVPRAPRGSATPDGSALPELGVHSPGRARGVVVAVVASYVLVQWLHVIEDAPYGRGLALAVPALLFVLGLSVLHTSRRFRFGPWRRAAWVTLPALAAGAYLPLFRYGVGWAIVGSFVIASVLLLVRPLVVRGVVVLAVVAAVTALAAVQPGYTWADVVYLAVSNALTGLVIFAVTRFADLINEVHQARHELARLAVERERTRFSRDLHDLLGYSLSAISLKCELALRLADDDPAQADSDLTAIMSISRQALADVRAVARSYREMSLSVQAASAVAMLESAGITVESALGDPDLPGQVDTVFATTLREAVTNMLRHSEAGQCRIAIYTGDHTARLIIANDGVASELARPGRTDFGDGRGGLSNLGSRLGSVGGRLEVRITDDGWFELSAVAPVRHTLDIETDTPTAVG